MFCDQCGTEIQPGYSACPKCGRVLAWPTAGVARSRLASHLQLLGLFWIIVGALWLVPSIFVLAMASMMNTVIPGEIEIVRQLGPLVLFVIGTGLMVTGAGGVAVGWGLLQRKSWARIAAIILGVLALVHFPFGTALGVYTLWVLLADEGGLEYERMVRA
ncbi:MAG: zinc ribbon domain-containing protein [Acidobacteriales bacterium]|nr:zinc ribbon domain-containing protein [Terriglobales bacterium]